MYVLVGRDAVQNYFSLIGFSSLAIIVLSLLIVWEAYVRAERWAWWAMLVTLALFIFPVHVLPLLQGINTNPSFKLSSWLRDAMTRPGISRSTLMALLDFVGGFVAQALSASTVFRSKTTTKA